MNYDAAERVGLEEPAAGNFRVFAKYGCFLALPEAIPKTLVGFAYQKLERVDSEQHRGHQTCRQWGCYKREGVPSCDALSQPFLR